MTGNIVIAGVDALTCVVLSKAEKYVAYGELVGTTKYTTLYPRCCTNRGRYNQVKLYFCVSCDYHNEQRLFP